MLNTSKDEAAWEEIPEIREYVENGILFFIFNKVNFMSQEDILAICKDFYSEDDVTKAKEVMYSKYKCPEKAKTHRGAAKKVNDIREMISFLSQNVASDIVFCITQCTQVPSVSMEFIDAPSMSRHMSVLRMEMQLMKAKYQSLATTMEELQSSMEEKRQGNSSFKMNDERNTITRQSILGQARSVETNKPKPSIADVVRSNSRQTKQRTIRNNDDESSNTRTKPSSKTEDDVSDVSESTTEDDDDWNLPYQEYKKLKRRLLRKQTEKNEDKVSRGEGGPSGPKRRRKPPIIGRGEGSALKAAQPMRNITLFVSRIQPDIASELLLSHVSQIAGVTTVECEQLEQKHSHYQSFKVTIKGMTHSKIKDLYKPENWDKDILVRRWYD